MNIGIIGARGLIGRRIVAEALRRGHRVVGLSRDLTSLPSNMGFDPGAITWRKADILDTESLVAAVQELDILVSAFGPGRASEDFAASIQESIRQAQSYVDGAKSIIRALERSPATRLIVVGGMGSLELSPGRQVVDAEDFPAILESIGVPAEFKKAVLKHREAFDLYRTSNRNWTYLSPAGLISAGERTGRFRVGGDQLLVDANGQSRISYEDYALALMDEVEIPRHIQRRFTVAY